MAMPRLALRAGRGGRPIVSVVLFNPSPRRTAKTVHLGLVLYDRGPDSTAQSVRRRTVQAVGPLDPWTLAAYDVHLPAEAQRDCVGVRWVRTEYLDGSTGISRPSHKGAPNRGPLDAGDNCLLERNAGRPEDSP